MIVLSVYVDDGPHAIKKIHIQEYKNLITYANAKKNVTLRNNMEHYCYEVMITSILSIY